MSEALKFDPSLKPNRDRLSPEIAALMDRAWYRNRANGFNVQFIRDDGKRDEWSFKDAERRDGFMDKLRRDGIACVASV